MRRTLRCMTAVAALLSTVALSACGEDGKLNVSVFGEDQQAASAPPPSAFARPTAVLTASEIAPEPEAPPAAAEEPP